jgi:hypothetical protein
VGLILQFLGATPLSLEFLFDLDECFPWLVLVARAEKMCLIDDTSGFALSVTVKPEALRGALLQYYATWAMNHTTSWSGELGPVSIGKTIGLPMPLELARNAPDLLHAFLDLVKSQLKPSPRA